MRIPTLIGAHADIDGTGYFSGEALSVGEMISPALLTFPFLGEYQQPLDGTSSVRPIKCKIAEAIEWLYRVKKWSITLSIPSGPGSEFGAVVIDLENATVDELNLIEQIAAFSSASATTDSAAYALRFDNTTFTTDSGLLSVHGDFLRGEYSYFCGGC